MSFLGKLFSKGPKRPQKPKLRTTGPMTPEHKRLVEFYARLKQLLKEDKYLAVSDYQDIVPDYADINDFFSSQKRGQTLEFYCEKNDLQAYWVEKFLEYYADIDDFKTIPDSVERHNKKYISRHLAAEKEYLDGILKQVDPAINLDDEQRKVVLSDEDYTLVVAGAGAGKTTTVAAKVKYLVDKQQIDPKHILVISYTNKAVGELRDKINKALKIPCPVTTFHSTGYAILRKREPAGRKVVDGGFMFNVINNYLKGNILEQPELVDKLILFFGSYFDAPYEGNDLNDFFNYLSKADFSTLKGNMNDYTEEIINQRTGKRISIAHEFLRSAQEVKIANYLYLNKIDYKYEKPYQFNILRARKPYTPDFTITQGDKTAYLEHFGITEDGRNNRYSAEELRKYKEAINDKVRLHRQHGTDLIYTFSAYKDRRPLLEHLREQLTAHGFELNPRPTKEVFEKIVSTEENRYILKLVNLVCTFIHNFKTNGYTVEKFHEWDDKTTNERTRLFLDLCQQCYHEYAKRLKEKHAVDFEDMINESARMLSQQMLADEIPDFKYIIVDEYQDISRQRFDLTRALSKLCRAKIIAVGDDWQSIYAYAGSDITLFTKFQDAMSYGIQLKITKTYRNAQEIIDIAGGFVQKNNAQLKKALVSPKHITNPIVVMTYSEEVDRNKTNGKGGRYYLMAPTVENAIGKILQENPRSSILLLGRYGFDAYSICKYGNFIYDEKTGGVKSSKYPKARIEFMTVHKAKGLGYDNVILINARNEVHGFPSQIQEDPVLQYVVKDDHSYEYAEERRLFYVALTRTKNRVYIVVPQQHPSKFVTEIIKDYPTVSVEGKIDDDPGVNADYKPCPICGYPLQLRYKPHYGLRLWLCSNEPEICDFMTNDPNGKDLSILKCGCCQDGYLIVKEGVKSYFLGCTNYNADKTGCNNTMTREQYLRMIKP